MRNQDVPHIFYYWHISPYVLLQTGKYTLYTLYGLLFGLAAVHGLGPAIAVAILVGLFAALTYFYWPRPKKPRRSFDPIDHRPLDDDEWKDFKGILANWEY